MSWFLSTVCVVLKVPYVLMSKYHVLVSKYRVCWPLSTMCVDV